MHLHAVCDGVGDCITARYIKSVGRDLVPVRQRQREIRRGHQIIRAACGTAITGNYQLRSDMRHGQRLWRIQTVFKRAQIRGSTGEGKADVRAGIHQIAAAHQ